MTNVYTAIGSDFADTLNGSNVVGAVEQFEGRGGDDIIDGKGGLFDIAIYTRESQGIVVNLAAGTVTGGDGGPNGDTLRSIEQVRGTDFVDTFNATGFGNAGASNISKQVTSNTFEGLGGNDIIVGNGATTVSYQSALAEVVVDLQDGTGHGIAAGDVADVGNDTFTGVTGVTGSHYDDIILGNNTTSDFLTGRGGDDLIDGRGGFDQASYINPNDTAGIVVDMGLGTVVGDAFTGTDTLRSIEGIRGTDWDDMYDAHLYGAAGALNIGNSAVNNAGSTTFNQFDGDLGNDTIIGNGNTKIAYFSATDGVTIVLGAGGSGTADDAPGGDGSVGHDTIISGVNSAAGSNFVDSYNASAFSTVAGSFNSFEGRGNDDTITGNGSTQIIYTSALAGVTVDLSAGTAHGTALGDVAGIGNDTITGGVNNVSGSNFDDIIIGTSGVDTLIGNSGNDILRGGAGADNLQGGDGIDFASYSMQVARLSPIWRRQARTPGPRRPATPITASKA